MDKIGVIVKVGKTSNIKFRHIKAYRAINFSDVKRLITKVNNSAIIIESILPYELDDAIDVIKIARELNKSIYIYNNSANSQEISLSDKYKIDIVSTLDELQASISKQLAILVSTAWCRETSLIGTDIKEYTEVETGNSTSEFQEAFSAIKNTEETHTTIIKNKDDLLKLGIKIKHSKEIENKMGVTEEYKRLKSLLDAVTIEKQQVESKLTQAFDKISYLLEIKDAIEDERNSYREILKGIESNSEVIEEPVGGAELDTANLKIADLQASNIELEQRILTYKSEVDTLNNRISIIQKDISSYKAEINNLNLEIKSKQLSIDRLNESLTDNEATKLELFNLQSDKQALEKNVVKLRSEIQRLNIELDRISNNDKVSEQEMQKVISLRNEIIQLTNEIDNTKNNLNIEIRGRILLSNIINKEVEINRGIEEELRDKIGEVENLRAVEKKLRGLLSSSDEELQQLAKKYSDLENEISRRKEIESLEKAEIQENFNKQINSLKVEVQTKTKDASRFKGELEEIRNQLSIKEAELAKIMASTGENKENERKALEVQKALEQSNDTLNKTIALLKSEVRTLSSKLAMTEDANERLEETNKNLRTNLATFKATSSQQILNTNGQTKQIITQGKVKLSCNYYGKGFIITVFGSGSYGVTTTAMSIARKLPKASVLYMDLDLLNPKADGWFKVQPILHSPELSNIQESLLKTSFGLLIERGSKFVIANKGGIIQKVVDSRNGINIDYFSGLYGKINPLKLMAVDFSELFTHLGNNYNYIIIDAGKYGLSDIGNELIKMLTKISYRSIIVTPNNKLDTRNMNIKLMQDNIDTEKMIWLLNLSETTNVDPAVKRSILKARPVVMPLSMQTYGSGLSFDRVPILKDKLGEVMSILSE